MELASRRTTTLPPTRTSSAFLLSSQPRVQRDPLGRQAVLAAALIQVRLLDPVADGLRRWLRTVATAPPASGQTAPTGGAPAGTEASDSASWTPFSQRMKCPPNRGNSSERRRRVGTFARTRRGGARRFRPRSSPETAGRDGKLAPVPRPSRSGRPPPAGRSAGGPRGRLALGRPGGARGEQREPGPSRRCDEREHLRVFVKRKHGSPPSPRGPPQARRAAPANFRGCGGKAPSGGRFG